MVIGEWQDLGFFSSLRLLGGLVDVYIQPGPRVSTWDMRLNNDWLVLSAGDKDEAKELALLAVRTRLRNSLDRVEALLPPREPEHHAPAVLLNTYQDTP